MANAPPHARTFRHRRQFSTSPRQPRYSDFINVLRRCTQTRCVCVRMQERIRINESEFGQSFWDGGVVAKRQISLAFWVWVSAEWSERGPSIFVHIIHILWIVEYMFEILSLAFYLSVFVWHSAKYTSPGGHLSRTTRFRPPPDCAMLNASERCGCCCCFSVVCHIFFVEDVADWLHTV